MAIIAKKIIDANIVYDYLESSFQQVVNSLKQQNYLTNEDIKFTLFRRQADFDGTLSVPMYASDEEAQKFNYGIFRFISGQIDPSKLTNLYNQVYTLELLCFEEDRADLEKILMSFARTLDAERPNLSEEDIVYTVFPNVDDFPQLTQTIDANGAEKFLASVMINLTFYQDIVHQSKVVVQLNGTPVEFDELTFNRALNEPIPDLAQSFDDSFLAAKSTFTISMSGFLTETPAMDYIYKWLLDERRLSDEIRFFYTDGKQIKSGVYIPNDVRITAPFDAVLQYSLQLLPKKNPQKLYYGVHFNGANNTGEKIIGSTVSATYEGDDFIRWEVEYLSNPATLSINSSGVEQATTIQQYFTALDKTDPVISFVMQRSDIVLKAVTGEVE
jgi:hypothetical protein